MSRREQRGVAAVELALTAGFLLMLAGGIVEFGHALYSYDILAKQARAAARYMAMRENADPTIEAAMRVEAQNIALCGLPACGTPPLPGLSATNVVVATPATDNSLANVSTGATTGSLDLVSVTITGYTFQPWIAIPFYTGSLAITFSPIRVFMPRVS